MSVLTTDGIFSVEIIFNDMSYPIEIYPLSNSIPRVLNELFVMGDIDLSEVDTISEFTINCLEDRNAR